MAGRKKNDSNILAILKNVFVSNRFFYGTLVFIVLSSLYVALVSLYPMAFDEEVHLGIIKAYAELWNPLDLIQKTSYDSFGAITTDPSWLYHYFMSFPYRIFMAVFQNETVTIILLRILNIALFVTAIWSYRKTLLLAGISRAKTHIILAVVALLPVTPLLAGQINYDNLILIVTAAIFYYAIVVWQALRNDNSLPVWPSIAIANLALFGSVIKYAFLPIALGVVIVLAITTAVALQKRKSKFFVTISKDWSNLAKNLRFVIILVSLTGLFLFGQRFVMNELQYGSLVPKCNVVLGEARCQAYGPYARDYMLAQNKPVDFEPLNLLQYTNEYWFPGMMKRLYFTLAGPTNDYATEHPLPTPILIAKYIFLAGVIALLIFAIKIFKEFPIFWLFLVPSLIYAGILLVRLHGAYVNTAEPVAINGRYLIPVLPFIGAMILVGYSKLLSTLKIQRFAGLLAAIVLLLLLQGGGPITYIIKSDNSWFWPDSPAPAINNGLRDILKPIINE
jgi:hypothetical protein